MPLVVIKVTGGNEAPTVEQKKELIAGFQNEVDFAYMKGYKPWEKLLAKYRS